MSEVCRGHSQDRSYIHSLRFILTMPVLVNGRQSYSLPQTGCHVLPHIWGQAYVLRAAAWETTLRFRTCLKSGTPAADRKFAGFGKYFRQAARQEVIICRTQSNQKGLLNLGDLPRGVKSVTCRRGSVLRVGDLTGSCNILGT